MAYGTYRVPVQNWKLIKIPPTHLFPFHYSGYLAPVTVPNLFEAKWNFESFIIIYQDWANSTNINAGSKIWKYKNT